jgi:hypothetical protein
MGKWEHRYSSARGIQSPATVHTKLSDLPPGTWQAQTRYVPDWEDVGQPVTIVGEHRREHDSTGGHRGILGGYMVRCVCGESWVSQNPSEAFMCPADPEVKPTSTSLEPDRG